jgi:HK97 family phage prohead protease
LLEDRRLIEHHGPEPGGVELVDHLVVRDRQRPVDIGLVAEIDIPDTTLGADMRALVKRGDVRGMSFEFGLARDGRGERWAGDDRTIVEVERLYDVSAVINPAYEGTDVALRSRTASADAERRARAARLLSRVRLYIARTKGV